MLKIKKLFFVFLFIIPLLSEASVKNYHGVFVKNPPKIDGLLNDNAWKSVNWSGGFVEFEPNAGKKPSQQTEFKIVFDNNYIYVAIRAFDSEPDKINRQFCRRDGGLGDMVAVSFDSYYDKRTAFFFGVTAAGVKDDIVFSNDGQTQDQTWDPVWYVKTNIDSLGWTAEMKIPLSQLRFSSNSDVWGLDIIRKIYRNGEMSSWQFIDPAKSGWISQFGQISGMSVLKPKKHIEISPYVMAGIKTYKPQKENPFETGKDWLYNAGLDGKIGITNDFTLDFTINPDFGQVEADPSVVNLTAYETYYREKRPFFVENKNITQMNISWRNEGLFYSRRIGRAPEGYPQLKNDEFAKIPDNTRILGAVKLSGKSKNGWSLGVIESITKREFAKIFQPNKQIVFQSVEPLTNYFVFRVQKDINKGNSLLGAMLTSTYRDIKNPNLLFLNKTATTGGIDFSQYFNNRKYLFSGKAIFSNITGTKQAMLLQQISSRRYFQRPDVDYVHIDSNLTSMTGSYFNLAFAKSAIKGFRYKLSLEYRSPMLELNDIGYLRNADRFFQMLWIGYDSKEATNLFRAYNMHIIQWLVYNTGFEYENLGFNIGFRAMFNNYWGFGLGLENDLPGLSPDFLRGGPEMRTTGSLNFSADFHSNEKKKFSFSLNANYNKMQQIDTGSFGIGANITYRPVDRFNLSINANYGNNYNFLQYITQFEYIKPFYLFSSLSQKTLNFTFRFEINFSPNLTLQYYGAPFVSVGDYYNLKIITNSRAPEFSERYRTVPAKLSDNQIYRIDVNGDDKTDYVLPNPDFNFQQYRSNLVLRWEYIPGSVIFLVWSHEQSNYLNTSVFNVIDNFKQLFTVFPTDVFLIKFQYRFM
jgi:hypothetical protein